MDFDFSLLNDVAVVTFTKKNGEKRVMRCTSNIDLVPLERHPKEGGEPFPHKEGVHRVWDFEKEDWRSFIDEKVISIEKAPSMAQEAVSEEPLAEVAV